MQDPVVFNIQKFSIHDGEGIRTTVFFKGCPLRCLWCHNPESQHFSPEIMYYPDRCVRCGACTALCPAGAVSSDIVTDRTLCTGCGICTDACLYDARQLVGAPMDVDTLFEAIIKDAAFYEVSGGGITLSGGEPLAQDMDYIEVLIRRLHRRGYRINIDTCGHVPYAHFQRVLPYTDMFLYDVKAVDDSLHRRLTGVSNSLILSNLRSLSLDGAPIHIRMPLISGLNDTDEAISRILDLLTSLTINAVSLLPYHTAGSDKYSRIGRGEAAVFTPPAEDRLQRIRDMLQQALNIPVKIGG